MAKDQPHWRQPARPPQFEELEPRILFSADIPAILPEDAGLPAPAVESRVIEDTVETQRASVSLETLPEAVADSEEVIFIEEEAATSKELVFVDTQVDNYAQLLKDLLAQDSDGQSDFEIILINADDNGLELIGETLSRYESVDAIHIFSHGSAGEITLGNTQLDGNTLAANAEQLGSWGESLSNDADLLIYGCDLASTEAGKTLVDTLADLIGADIAASTDLTGSAIHGGDWDLEYQRGSIEANIALSATGQASYYGLLAVSVDALTTVTDDTAATSLTVSHTSSGSDRLMIVGLSMHEDRGPVSAVTYNGTALTLVGTAQNGADQARIELWALIAPDTGTHDVVIDLAGGSHGVVVGVTTFNGVDQNTPYGAFFSATGDSSSIDLNGIVSATDEQVFAVVDHHKGLDLTPNSGQTEQWDLNTDATGGNANGGGYLISGAASVDLNWTPSISEKWAVGAISLKPSAQAAPTNIVLTQTTQVAIANPSFESQPLTDGGTTTNNISSWTINPVDGSMGIWNPDNSSYPEEAPDGSNVAFIDVTPSEQTISQTLAETFEPNQSYTLSAWVGDHSALGENDGWEIRLLAGNQLLGSVSNSDYNPSDGEFIKATLQLDADALSTFSQSYGELLQIQLSATNQGSSNNAHFDDVQLEYTYLNVAGGAATGTIVGDIASVSDANSGETFSYTLTDNAGGRFAIDANTGVITVADGTLLDYASNSSHAITIRATDSSGLSYDETFTVQVLKPLNSVPAGQTVDEDATLTFSAANGNAIVVNQGELSSNTPQVTLSSSNGTLTLGQTSGLSFSSGDGSADASMTFSGSVADINAALEGMTFTPTADFNGSASVQITTWEDSALLGAYTFEDSANLGADSGPGSADDGSVTGATAAIDTTRGNVLSLAASNGSDRLDIPTLYAQPQDLTLSAWINYTGANDGEIITLGDSVLIRVTSTQIFASVFNGTTWTAARYDVALADTGWHNIAYSVDSASNTQTLYLDGVAVATTNETLPIDYSLYTQTAIGHHADPATALYSFDGEIDDARIYDRALTAQEIVSIVNTPPRSETETISITVNALNDAPEFPLGTGYVRTDISTAEDRGYGVEQQSDGKLLVAGYSFNGISYEFSLVRYNSDGSLDTSFGTGGIATTDITANGDIAYDLAIQSDGKILVAGYSNNGSSDEIAVVRYNSDGSLDTTFGTSGIVTTNISSGNDQANSITLQSDGRILIAGNSNNQLTVLRYNSDGSLDTTFNSTGIVTTDVSLGVDIANAVIQLTDGKILLAGTSDNGLDNDFTLLRYNRDGSLDTTFGSGDGIVTTDFGPGDDSGLTIALQNDGKILLGGNASNGTDNDFALARYNSDGTLDTSFGTAGLVTTNISGNDEGFELLIQDDGKILLAGKSNNGADGDYTLARYNSDGSLDSGFGSSGTVITDFGLGIDKIRGIVIQSDGKILASGYSSNGTDFDFSLARYNSDGSLDATFDSGLLNATPLFTEGGSAVVMDTDVRLTDPELSPLDNFSGATLTLQRNGGANADDIFSASGNLAALSEGGNLDLSGVTIGTVTTNSGGTLVLTFNGSATQARVNETLQSLAYSNSSDAPAASVQIDWTFDDGNTGSQGSGGALSTTGSVTVSISGVNDAPVNTVPASINVTEDVATAITGISIADVDASNNAVLVTLSVTRGSLAASSSGGVTVGGTATDLTLSGTVAEINGFIAASNISYTTASNATEDATLTVTTSDEGNSGSGGTLTDTDSITLVVSAANDAPTDIYFSSALEVNSGATDQYGEASSFADFPTTAISVEILFTGGTIPSDGAAIASYAISGTSNEFLLYANNGGTLNVFIKNTSVSTGISSSSLFDGNTHQLSVTWDSTTGDLNVYVDGAHEFNTIIETGNPFTAGGSFIIGQEQDSVGGSFSNTQLFSGSYEEVRIFNDVRTASEVATYTGKVLANPSGEQGLVSNWQMDAITGGVIADETGNHNLVLNGATLPSLLESAIGTVAENSAAGTVVGLLRAQDPDRPETFTYTIVNDPSGFFEISGDNVQVKAGATLDYETATSHNITVRVTDSGGATFDKVLTINVTDVNEAPVNTVPGAQTVDEDTPLSIGGISVADEDGNLATVQLTVTNGTLKISLSGAASISAGANGSATLTLSGTQSDINASLGSLAYQGNSNANGSDTLTVLSTDSNGLTTSTPIAITVNPINDAPLLYLDLDNSSAVGGYDFAASYTENGSAVAIIDSDASIFETDSANLSSLTVTITNALDGSDESLGYDLTGTSISAVQNWDLGTNTVTLTLSGSDSVSNYQQVLRTLTYINASEGMDTTSRVITFVANDGGLDSATRTTTVTLTAVNDAPALDNSATFSFTTIAEDDTGNNGNTVAEIISSLSGDRITDVDAGAVEGIAVVGSALVLGGVSEWQYSIDNGSTWNALNTSWANSVLLRPGDRIRGLPNTVDGTRSGGLPYIQFRAWDQSDGNSAGSVVDTGTNGGTTAYSTAIGKAEITVTSINDAPVLSAIEGSALAYTENDAATAITGSLVVADVDSANISSAVVRITGNYQNGGDLLAFSDTANISGSWDASTGTLTLSGADTLAAYQSALRSVSYANNSDNPSTLTRTVTFTVNDGGVDSAAVTRDITLTAINDAPVASNLSTAETYVEDTPLNLVDIVVTDPDSDVTVTLTLSDTAAGSLSTGTSGAASSTFSAGVWSASGAVADVNALLAALVFTPGTDYNSSFSLATKVDDGVNAAVTGSKTFTGTAVNDAPSFSLLGNQSVAYESGAHTVAGFATASPGGGSDEAAQTFTYSVSNDNASLFSSGPAIDANGQLSYTVANGQTGSAIVTVSVTDSGGTANGGVDTSASQTFTISVGVNTAPTITAIADQSIDEDTATAALNFSVADAETAAASLTVSASSSDTTLIPNANLLLTDAGGGNWSITVTPGANLSGSATITVSVSDGTTSSSETFVVTVNAVNDDPFNTGTLPTDIVVVEDVATDIDLSSLDLADIDAAGGSLTLTLGTSSGGALSALAGSGITLGGTSSSLTLTGSLTDLNNYLNTAGLLSYLHGTPHTNGNNADSLSITLNDNGNSGTGGGTDISLGNINVDITAVNDEQVLDTNLGLTLNEGATALIDNSLLAASDVDNSPAQLLYTVTSGPSRGQLELTTAAGIAISSFTQDDIDNNRLVYVHDNSESTVDSFDFSLDDGAGSTSSGTFNISIALLNDNVPIIAAGQSFLISELAANGSSLGSVAASDVDTGTSLSGWNIAGGNTDGIFAIDSASGEITVVDRSKLDYDNTPSYTLDLTVSDGTNTSAMQSIVINVSDASPLIAAGQTFSIAEDASNESTVGTVSTSGDTPTSFALTAGNTGGVFAITSSGQLIVADSTALDYETLSSYTLTVEASDGNNTVNETITVTVTDVNDVAPVITSDGGASSASLAIAENQTAVTTVIASDADSTPFYSIVGGADAAKFAIDSSSGVLTLNSTADYENPTDANGDNVYEVTVEASDGHFSDQQDIFLSIANINDNAPLLEDVLVEVDESLAGGSTVLDLADTVTANDTDRDGDALRFRLLSGNEVGMFSLDAATGVLTVSNDSLLDFEQTPQYTLLVEASDGTFTDTATVTVQLNNINEAPEIIAPDTLTTKEDTPLSFVDSQGASIVVNDADAADQPLELQLSASNGSLSIAPSSQNLVVDQSPDGTILALSGSQDELNLALESLVFTPDADYNGIAHVQLSLNDLGHSGSGGALSVSDLIEITIDPVNDLPQVTVPPEIAPLLPGESLNFADNLEALLQLADVDGQDIHEQLLITVPSGSLSVADTNGLEVVDGQGSSTLILEGSLLDLNKALRGLVFTPEPGFHGDITLQIEARDPGSASVGDPVVTHVELSFTVQPPAPAEQPAPVLQLPDTPQDHVTPPAFVVAEPAPFQPPLDEPTPRKARNVTLLRDGEFHLDWAGTDKDSPLLTRVFEGDSTPPPAHSHNPVDWVAKQMKLMGSWLDPELESADAQSHFYLLPFANAEDGEKSTDQTSLTLKAIEISAVGATIGTALWILRGGSLLTSLLLSYPAWKNFDPLPVLGSGGELPASAPAKPGTAQSKFTSLAATEDSPFMMRSTYDARV